MSIHTSIIYNKFPNMFSRYEKGSESCWGKSRLLQMPALRPPLYVSTM